MNRSESSSMARSRLAGGTALAAIVVIGVAVASRVGVTPAALGGASIDPGTSSSDGAAARWEGSANDIQLAVELDSTHLSARAQIKARITITNAGSKPAGYAVGPCGSISTMLARLPDLPTAAGASWSGVLAQAKDYLLTGGAPPPPDEIWVDADPITCSRAGDAVRTLAAGERATATVSWTPSYVPGVPVPEGDILLRVTVRHRPAPTATDPSSTDGFRALTVEGTIVIEKGAPGPIPAAEAADAVIADTGFKEWLNGTTPDTWRVGHVFLVYIGTTQQGIVPPGPSWEVDLFRGDGPGQEWAIGFVDPVTGALRSLTLCDASCVN